MQRRIVLYSVGVLAGGALLPGLTHAQGVYPDHPINLVIPFPPGGLADTVGRMLVPALEAALGKPLVPVNRAGAAGAIGAASVVNAKADGYTLLFTLSSISTLPEQSRVNNQKPSFLLNQLKPVARVSTDPMVVLTHADSPYKDFRQLLADAKVRPGVVSYGSSGVYGTVHVPAEMLAHAAGVKFNHIPYTGGGPLLQGLLGKQVDFTLLPRSSSMVHLRGGRVRALAVLDNQRWPQLPDVPTTRELGLDVNYLPWTGLLAPEGTPEPILAKLRGAVSQVIKSPAFLASLEKSEGTLAYMDSAEFQKFWDSEIGRLNEVIKLIGKME
jgi:tripartite-type tricarboxylate transporter receptor subunit TctC